ncbi:MAG: peptidase MA family metallohydrolase [bacterium]
MKRWLTIILLVIGIIPQFADAATWKERRENKIKVFYHTGDEKNVDGVLSAVSKAMPDLLEKLGVELKYPVKIYLVSSEDEFHNITGSKIPEWSHGVSFSQTGQILLKSPRFAKDIQTLHRTAIHELVHALIAQRVGQNIPRWLNEGLALVLSGEGPTKPRIPLSRAVWSGKLIWLENIDQVNYFSQSMADVAYLQSYHAAEYLIKKYGWETIRQMLTSLGSGKTWEETILQTTGKTHEAFESSWLENLKKSYRWTILLDIHIYLFMGATLLVLLSGILVFRRKRKLYRRWEEEEAMGENIC